MDDAATARAMDGAGLAHAAPRLHRLHLHGDALLADLEHPTLTFLEARGLTAFGAWADGAALPAVAMIATDATDARAIAAAKFPHLQSLDLSRGRMACAVETIARSSVAAQLRDVSLPPVRDALDAAAAQRALRYLPRLASGTVADWYGEPVTLRHPTAKLGVPPAKPWRPRELVDAALALGLEVAGQAHVVSVLELCHVMESRYSRLDADARDAWTQLWRHIDACREPVTIPRELWDRAMLPCLDAFIDDGWRRFAAALPGLAGDVRAQPR